MTKYHRLFYFLNYLEEQDILIYFQVFQNGGNFQNYIRPALLYNPLEYLKEFIQLFFFQELIQVVIPFFK